MTKTEWDPGTMSASTEPTDRKATSHAELPAFLLFLFNVGYILGASYSLYQFYIFCQAAAVSLPLTRQYSYFGPYQDQMDFEWTIFSPVIVKSIPYYLLHLIISQTLKKTLPQVLSIFHVAFSSSMLLTILGWHGLLVCYSVVSMMFVVMMKRKKYLIWLMWCFILICLNTRQFTEILGIWLEDVTDGEYLISVIVAWIILRSLSFSLEICEKDSSSHGDSLFLFVQCLAYCLYFPLVLTGPYMSYTDFLNGMNSRSDGWTLMKVMHFFFRLVRFFLVLLVTDISLHHFYAHALFEFPYALWNLNAWELAGFVYFLLVFFFFKYIVFYGLPATFALFDGFDPPRHPRCVLVVYKASDVWRYFDLGIYKFMVKHIYKPFIGSERSIVRKLQGSVIVFTFIYVWHGVSNSIFWWAFINFLGVTSEKLFDLFLISDFYQRIQIKYLTGWKSRILHGFVYAIFILATVVSMVIFLSSLENSKVIFEKIFIAGFPDVTFTTLFFFYCIAQCGISVEQYRHRYSQISK